MLKGADLDKILDEGQGDAGFNDPVPEIESSAPATGKGKGGSRSAFAFPKTKEAAPTAPAGEVAAEAIASSAAAAEEEVRQPFSRKPVLGAAPMPPEGTTEDNFELVQAIDLEARSKGYKDADEYNVWVTKEHDRLEAEKKKDRDPEAEQVAEEMQAGELAPGIKKAPVYMPPGAFPGDRSKLGKAYEKHVEEQLQEGNKAFMQEPAKKAVNDFDFEYVFQRPEHDFRRANDGQIVKFRLDDAAEPIEAEVGARKLAWALDKMARRMKIGDIMTVIGRNEYAFSDEEAYEPNTERRWKVELLDISGESYDKFKLDVWQRVDKANELRLVGNDMFKQNRLLRALDYYERGSSLMDVLEAEDLSAMGGKGKGKVDKVAAEKNKRIWACQQPLLLNWALILMKQGKWQQAERKCTEVLMDIEKECVKALYRRGQCNIHLGDHEQARYDLRRAAELDQSIKGEVAKHLRTVSEMQKKQDEKDRGLATSMVAGMLKKKDARVSKPAPKEAPPEDPTSTMMHHLKTQENSADADGVDEDTYCRQREQIYNHFMAGQFAAPGAKDGDE